MYKIIVLEDEPTVRKDLVLLTPWESLGIICVGEADNGEMGLDLAMQLRPDIILTDIRMPGMDGLEFIEKHKKWCTDNNLEFPEFLVLSGYSEFEYARQGIRLGVSEYLLKPIDDQNLIAALLRVKERIETKKEKSPVYQTVFQEFIENEKDSKKFEGYIARAVYIIQENFITGITIEETAMQLGISAGHLSRLFKQETGYTFGDYLVYVRIKRAVELLRENKDIVILMIF